MGSTFNVKPQSFSLITGAPISPPISPIAIGLCRSEFLSNDRHTLRLPRRRWKKLRSRPQPHTRKFLFKASLESQPIVFFAAAVATVSAVTVVYFTYPRKQLDMKQMTGRLTLALSKQIRSMVSWILTDPNPQDMMKKVSVDESKDRMEKTREINHENNDTSDEINGRETDVTPGGALIAMAHQFQSNMDDSSSQDHSVSQEPETIEISSLPFLLSKNGIPNAHGHSNSVASEVSVAVMESRLSDAISSSDHIYVETDKSGIKLDFLETDERKDLKQVLNESARKELHTINETSLEQLDNLEQLSMRATLQMKSSYASLMNNVLSEGSNLTACNVIDKLEEDRHLGYYSRTFFCQQKDSRNYKALRKKDKSVFHGDRLKNSSPSSDPKERHNPSWKLRVYNQLLREGRLNDCIELLEDLEEKSLLDMDKVYHTRFFDVCKSQKAVKEAFRFTRFIRNPTLSTFNMLLSVCTSSQDSEGALQVLQHVQKAGLKADCKLYTSLISTCAKSGKIDTMFKVFHEMVNAGVEPNLHTFGALIDGCGKAGQVAKAFGAYGILRSKNLKPDRVIFNALITACGQSRAVDRAFDVLAEMKAEMQPIDPDHVTIGALMKACASAGQVERVKEVYNMIHKYDIRGTAELYTIAVNSCSHPHHADWEFACSVYDDMIRKSVAPDEMFISALIDVAGHAGKVDAAFEILQEARARGMHVGIISYSSLMGACSNAKVWQKALGLYEDIKRLNLKPTVSMMNALITALCDADQLQKAMETLIELKGTGLRPNTITYSILLVASEKKDDLEGGLMLISEAKKDGVTPNLVMCRSLIAMCLRRFQAAYTFDEPVLSFTSGRVQLNSKWTSLALMVYRETIIAGVTPTVDELSILLGCLQLPRDVSVKNKLIENLGVDTGTSKGANLLSFIDGFGEYDPRALSLVEEAASRGVIPLVSLKDSPIVVDARNFQVHTAEVYLLTVLKGLKHRLAAGVKLPNVIILVPTEKTKIQTSSGEKIVNTAGRLSQAVAALLRRLGLSYLGHESHGKIRINGLTIRKWFQPKLDSHFRTRRIDRSLSPRHLGSGISRQQSKIRTDHLSLK